MFQFEKAEILVTMLAGSLVWDGGFNVVQAGTSAIKEYHNHTSDTVQAEILEENPWMNDNMACIRKCNEEWKVEADIRTLAALNVQAIELAKKIKIRATEVKQHLLAVRESKVKALEAVKVWGPWLEEYVTWREAGGYDWGPRYVIDEREIIVPWTGEQKGLDEMNRLKIELDTLERHGDGEIPDSQEQDGDVINSQEQEGVIDGGRGAIEPSGGSVVTIPKGGVVGQFGEISSAPSKSPAGAVVVSSGKRLKSNCSMSMK
ncbi:hypothetical protein NHQ30_005158 [Ciborinia camelliae]|nr:hypothetical protein NHQ30_005158 [Ciborinia camelliae]